MNGRLKSAKITKSRNFYSLLLVTGLAKLCGILTAAQHLFHLKMLTREELQHLCLQQIIFTNVVITIQSYWKHQTRFLWMNERRGLFCSLQWIYTFLSKTVKAQLDYKPYINDSFCIQEVRELCLVITKDHFFFRLHTCLASLGCGKHFASKFFIWHHIFVLASFRREKLSKFSQF